MTSGHLIGANLSVITVTYESERVIGGWLDSVQEWLPGAEVIVVDNSATEATADIVGEHPCNALVVRSGGNIGFARGCNLGATHATREFVWFLNPDARVVGVDESLVLTDFGRSDFGIGETLMLEGADAAAHIYRHRSRQGEWAAHVLTPLWPRVLGAAPWSVRHGDGWASGASLLMRKTDFSAVGGFGETFFLLYEDRELSWRGAKAGLLPNPVRGLTVTHELGTASSAENLDVRRRAWAVLSWIEYVGLTESQQRARRAAGAIVAGLRTSARLGRMLSFGDGSKLSRKLASAGDVLEFLSDADRFSSGYYPRARVALSLACPEEDSQS